MRKTILILAILISGFGLLITLSPYLLEMTGLDLPVKKYVIRKVVKSDYKQFDANNLHIGLNSLEIDDIRYAAADQDFELNIRKIRLHFNFWQLWTNPTQPQRALKTIYLLNPSIVINEKGKVRRSGGQEKDEIALRSEEIFSTIENIESIGNIQIRDGEVLWKESAGHLVKIAQGISGWINTQDYTNIQLNASGRIFSEDKNNLQITSRINVSDKQLNTTITLDDYVVSTPSMRAIFETIPVTSGKLSGSIMLINHGFRMDSTLVNGVVKVERFGMDIPSAEIRDLNFEMKISDNFLSVKAARGVLLGQAPFLLDVTIADILRPEIHADLSATGFPLNYFNRYVKQIPFNDSQTDLELEFDFKKGRAALNGELNSHAITVFGDVFKNFRMYFNWNPETFGIDYFNAIWKGLAVNGNAQYNTARKHLGVKIHGFQQLGEHVIFNRISNKIQKFDINFDYFSDKQALAGEWSYSLAEERDTVLNVSGDISSRNETLYLGTGQKRNSMLNAFIHVRDFLSNPSLEMARLENFPVELLTTAPVIKDLFRKIDTEISLSGKLNDLKGQILISGIGEAPELFRLDTEIRDLFRENKNISGQINVKNLQGAYEFVFNNSFLGGDFNLGTGIDGEFYIDLTKEEQLVGQVLIEDFKIIQAFADSAVSSDFRNLGSLNGTMAIAGTVYEPTLHSRLVAEKFVFNDIGYYQAELDLKADRTMIKADTILISLNNSPVLQGNLNWTLLNNFIEGQFSGSDINLLDIMNTFDISSETLSGTTAYRIKTGGPVKSPHIEAEFDVSDGVLKNIPFDQLNIRLTDIVKPDGNILEFNDHFISLENFYIEEEGRYHLHSIGKLPMNSRDDIDLVVNFDGDLFGLLHYWEPFFGDGVSLVDLSMQIGGNSENLRIRNAQATIERGELWLRSVAPHIEDIKGKILLREGTNQIDFVDFQGAVDGQKLYINTVRDIVTESGKKLAHWYFEDLDLDFGILAMETTDGGVGLNIPGLMKSDDQGRFQLSGKEKDEKFYFAGPVKHPLAYGKITGYNTRLTFPFLINEQPGQKPSVAVQFLKNMEWDVHVLPGENVLYFRDIPAYIDNVQAEIYVDESSEGLKFSGILDQGNFQTIGSLESTRGRMEYLDQNFRVDMFNVEFTEGELFPDVSGRAWTSIRDSVGAASKTIYLQLYVIDPETGQERQQGNWENFKFKLVSADPQIGETQEQVLAYMGYSVDNIREKATSVGGAMTEKYLIRPLLRPIERALERNLGMDLVRFNSSIAKNLFYGSLGAQNGISADPAAQLNPFVSTAPYLFLMQSSEVTVGKYLTQDIYLTYTGQLVSVYDQVDTGFDFNHSVGVEYRFLRNILLEVEYDRELMGFYRVLNERQYMEDFKIRLRHSFSF